MTEIQEVNYFFNNLRGRNYKDLPCIIGSFDYSFLNSTVTTGVIKICGGRIYTKKKS